MHLQEYRSYLIVFFATIVRYYDYALLGISASVLSKNFMPGINDGEQILIFFGFFSLTMLIRPLGSIIFGRIGDKLGRIASLKISTLMAALSTGCIAFIPSFEFWEWGSVISLMLCRMLFLVSLAGETDAIKIYVAEKIGKNRRNFAIGIVSFSSQLGVLLASIMYFMTTSLDDISWLWRVNFLLGGLMGLCVVIMRKYLQESQVYIKNKHSQISDINLGFIAIIRTHKLKFLLALLINGTIGGIYYFLIIFWSTFVGNVVDVTSPAQATFHNIEVIALYSIACLLSGFIADKVKNVIQTTIALICSVFTVFLMAIMLQKQIPVYHLHYALAFLAPFYIVPCSIKVQSLFATNIRMRMFSLSHSLGSLILSSTTPFICMLLWQWRESSLLVLSYFLMQLILLFIALTIITKKNYISMFE